MNSVENIPPHSVPSVGNSRTEPTLVAVNTNDIAVRREVVPPSADLSGELETVVSTLAVSPISPIERGHGVLAVLRRIVQTESGVLNVAAGLGRFLERMWSGPVIESFVRSIHLRAEALAEGRGGEGLDAIALVHDLRSFLEWYSLRRMSLQACRREGFVEADPDALFNLHIAHDVRRWGVDGMVVSAGLRFIARAHETVWFKVSARHERRDVAVRSGWISWRDETEGIAAQRAEIAPRFAALTPVRPQRQRCVVDHVEVFVPYAALDLPAGRREIELEAGIYAQSGELVVSATVLEMVQIPACIGDIPVVPAPQALGVWPSDPATGHAIAVARSAVRFEGDPGWEERILETRVDLTLVGVAGERLELEARLRGSDGAAVGVHDRGRAGLLEPCLGRVAILPQQAVSKLPGVRVSIPVAELDLSPGEHRLFVETVVVASDGRIVCGAIEPVVVESVPRAPSESPEREPIEPHIAADADLDVRAVVVDSVSRDERVLLEVGVVAATRDWESSPYRLVVSLECQDGTAIRNTAAADRPVLRSVWFGGERRSPGEPRVVRVSFDAREFARFLKAKGPAPRALVTRIVIANEAGRTVFETTRVVSADFAAEVRAATPPERIDIPVRLVDVSLPRESGADAGRTFLLTLNVKRSAQESDRCLVYYEFFDHCGETRPARGVTEELRGDIATVRFPFVGRVAERRWYQTTVEVPYKDSLAVGSFPAGIVVTVFSPRGEYWETARYPLAAELPREVTESMSRLSSRRSGALAEVLAEPSAPLTGGVTPTAPGLLSKLRSALIG